MEIVATQSHAAGNRFHRSPVTVVRLAAAAADADPAAAHGRLAPLLGGPAPGDPGSLFAATAAALAAAAGDPLAGTRIVAAGEVVLVHGATAIAAAAATRAGVLLAAALAGPLPAGTIAAAVTGLRRTLPSPTDRALLRAGTARGLSPRPGPAGSGSHFGEGVRMRRTLGTVGERTPFVSFETARSRLLVARLLAAHGVPVLRLSLATSPAAAGAAVARLGGRAIIRKVTPDDGGMPVPVSTPADVAAAFGAVGERAAIVAEPPPGPPWRFLVAGGRSVAALRMDPGRAPVDATAAAHADSHLLAERAALVVASDVAAVDLVAQDMGRPAGESGARVADVRLGPALDPFLAAVAAPEALADRVLAALLDGAGEGRIPIVAVAGAGAPAVAAALAETWRGEGRRVGTAGRAGLAVAGLVLFDDDRRGRRGLPLLVDHPLADAAVVEVDADDLWRHGLGHPRIDVAVIDGAVAGPVADLLAALADIAVVAGPGAPPLPSAVHAIAAADAAGAAAAAHAAVGPR
ncbi:MAG: hypothetical protein IT561_09570 [Alphaproteobacteria bacterium]|nr:hypothetical protein [Alphaproteobacteria bacterium]